jgi:hypothetical protein
MYAAPHAYFNGPLWLGLEDKMEGRDRHKQRAWSKPSNLPRGFRTHQAVAFGLDIDHGDLYSA